MYAIVNIAGEQFKVRKGDELRVPHMHLEPGKKIVYDEVLFVDDGKDVKIGTPPEFEARTAAPSDLVYEHRSCIKRSHHY